MQQRLAEKTAAAVAFSRNFLANTAAGLVTATLLGFWSPALQKEEPVQPEIVGKLNIDPASGKILDRVAVEEEPTVPQLRLKPVLVNYALPALAPEPPAPAEPAPQMTRKLAAKPQPAAKAPQPSAPDPESRDMPAESSAAIAAPERMAESEGWMSKLAPGALVSKLAPVAGHVSGYVAGGVSAARRAVADRLEAVGF